MNYNDIIHPPEISSQAEIKDDADESNQTSEQQHIPSNLKNNEVTHSKAEEPQQSNILGNLSTIINKDRLTMLTNRLHLSEDQITAFDNLFKLQSKGLVEYTQKQISGEPNVNAHDYIIFNQDFDLLAEEVLSRNQLEKYQSLRSAEKISAIDNSSTKKSNSLALKLELNEEQKNAVYAAYYEHAHNPNFDIYGTIGNLLSKEQAEKFSIVIEIDAKKLDALKEN